MPTSPEAASVVEQLKILANSGTHTLIDNMDLRALLAVVEAAKTHKHRCVRIVQYAGDFGHCKFCDALDALCTPDSAEPKDAEGAKP